MLEIKRWRERLLTVGMETIFLFLLRQVDIFITRKGAGVVAFLEGIRLLLKLLDAIGVTSLFLGLKLVSISFMAQIHTLHLSFGDLIRDHEICGFHIWIFCHLPLVHLELGPNVLDQIFHVFLVII